MPLFAKRRAVVRFTSDREGRRVQVRGPFSDADRAKLERLLVTLPIRKGQVDLRKDGNGRTRLVFDKDIPERWHQPIRNLIGNITRL
jgi:hypothetical protein